MDYQSPYELYQNVKLVFSKYPKNGRVAISMVAEDGEPILKATVNLPDAQIAEDEVIIKDWAENEGILKWLQKQRIISSPIREIATGYTYASVCKLLKTN